MKISVGVFEAKARLSQLLNEIDAGNEVTITRSRRPVAKLVSPSPSGTLVIVRRSTPEQSRKAAARLKRSMPRAAAEGDITARQLRDEFWN